MRIKVVRQCPRRRKGLRRHLRKSLHRKHKDILCTLDRFRAPDFPLLRLNIGTIDLGVKGLQGSCQVLIVDDPYGGVILY